MRKCNSPMLGLVMIAIVGIAGCACQSGQEVVIPASDTTPPSLIMDLHLPSGIVVSVTSVSQPATIPVPGGGRVTVIVKATDSEGVQDAQIWAYEPQGGLIGRPSASNFDGRGPGQNGCTERVVKQNLDLRKPPQGGTTFDVSARGLNFGGGDVRTPTITLQAQ